MMQAIPMMMTVATSPMPLTLAMSMGIFGFWFFLIFLINDNGGHISNTIHDNVSYAYVACTFFIYYFSTFLFIIYYSFLNIFAFLVVFFALLNT